MYLSSIQSFVFVHVLRACVRTVCIYKRGPTFRLEERRGRLLFLLLRFSIFFGLGRVPRGPCLGLAAPADSLLTDRDTSHDTSLIFDAAVFRRNRKSMARRCHCRSSSCAAAQSSKLHDERWGPVPRRIKLIGRWDIASAVPRS